MNPGMLFPGQGSQFVGMGRDLYDAFPGARELYAQANAALGFDIASLSFEGDMEELTQTRNAQPAILLHSLAALGVLTEGGVEVSVVAGHSLGEFTALCAAGSLEPMDALRIVRRRGELMYETGLERPGAMAAVMGLDADLVDSCCERTDGIVVVANYNSPGQVAISGEVNAVDAAAALCREAGARRAVRLPVSGAFHSPLMEPAVAEFASFLSGFEIRAPRPTWVANVTGAPAGRSGEVADLLARQLSSPVRWIDSMRAFAGECGGRALEVGPGKVLAGLMKRCAPEVEVSPAGDVEATAKILGAA